MYRIVAQHFLTQGIHLFELQDDVSHQKYMRSARDILSCEKIRTALSPKEAAVIQWVYNEEENAKRPPA